MHATVHPSPVIPPEPRPDLSAPWFRQAVAEEIARRCRA